MFYIGHSLILYPAAGQVISNCCRSYTLYVKYFSQYICYKIYVEFELSQHIIDIWPEWPNNLTT